MQNVTNLQQLIDLLKKNRFYHKIIRQQYQTVIKYDNVYSYFDKNGKYVKSVVTNCAA